MQMYKQNIEGYILELISDKIITIEDELMFEAYG